MSLSSKDYTLLKVGYVPISASLVSPGDRRRFVYYARKRGIEFEIADPGKNYDVVVLSSRADVSVWSRYSGGKVVYDLIDSYLAIPRSSIKGRLRGLFKFLSRQSRYPQLDHWRATGGMCSRADAVICSTSEQRRDIETYCANVHIILDAHMGVMRDTKRDYSVQTPFKLVWEGLPQNLCSLAALRPVLEQLRERHAVEVHVVTDAEFFRYLGRYGKADSRAELQAILPGAQLHVWDEADCARIICGCDLAVIPLPLDDPFASGKPENKLLLFWRMGMPVVTSPTPAYSRAMNSAGVDLMANDTAGWVSQIETLIQNPDARQRAGNAGRNYAECEFSEASLLARWDAVFESIGISFHRVDHPETASSSAGNP